MSSRFSTYSFVSPHISSSYESFFAKQDDFAEFADFERLCNVTVRRVKATSPIKPLDLKHVTLRGGKKNDKPVKTASKGGNEKSIKNLTHRKKATEKNSATKDLSTSKYVTHRTKAAKMCGSPKNSATSKHVTMRRKRASKASKSPTSKHVTIRKKHGNTTNSTKASSASKPDHSQKHVSNVTHRKRRVAKTKKVVSSESSDSFASIDSVSGTKLKKDFVYKFFAGLKDMPEPVSTTDESCLSGSEEEVYNWSDDN